jgi:NAD(P)-dependent dehydrogenase (short-subunit alcohol dehydrogenase family)
VTRLDGSRFEGKVAIVTGAGSGIGQATAVRLAAEGATVLAVDVDGAGLDVTAKESDRVHPHVADVGDETAVAGTVRAAVEPFGRLDVLANIAGIMRTAHTHECPTDVWELVLRVNLTGTFLMCREALPHLLETKGTIVNCASTASFFGHPWMAAYAASKGGIAALTQSLAIEYAKQGVRVNAVAPGSVQTGISANITFPDGADLSLLTRIMSPTGPAGPESIASVVALLASEDGKHMTGECVRVDGGTHA